MALSNLISVLGVQDDDVMGQTIAKKKNLTYYRW
jgi:hypothetical protein